MRRRAHACALTLALAVWGAASTGRGEASMTIRAEGSGFRDSTSAAPVGGNEGRTLGEQRLKAVEHAAALWSKRIDSSVPIEARVVFSALGCDENGGVVGTARAQDQLRLPAGMGPDYWYPSALADSLAGRDLVPGAPDIIMQFNSSVDAECATRLRGFYYGLDGNHGDKIDLVQIALHELGHGLGFSSFIAPSGESELAGSIDAFSAHVYDLDLDKSWSELTPAERARSATNTRRVVWDGAEATRASARYLAKGTASLTLTPPVDDFSGGVSTAGFAENPALAPVSGRLVRASPIDGCGKQTRSLSGAVALVDLSTGSCGVLQIAEQLADAGAVAALMIIPAREESPATPLPDATPRSTLPILTLSSADGERIGRALARGTLTATLGGDPIQPQGADVRGRPLLYTPSPLAPGSSVSHFDTSPQPDLLMEPYTSRRAAHDVDLTVAVLRDMGWAALCGNGQRDGDEQCDEGLDNSDGPAARCRTSCLLAGCGDGMLDPGEACDSARANSAVVPDACRLDCRDAGCGDGVIDALEACDDGAQNRDDVPGACRRDCTRAPCAPPSSSRSCVATPLCPDTCGPGDGPRDGGAESDARVTPFRPWEDVQTTHPQTHGQGCSVRGLPAAGGRWPGASMLIALVALGRALRPRRARD